MRRSSPSTRPRVRGISTRGPQHESGAWLMSIPGGAVGIRQPPPQSWPACWAELAQHVARASRDLLHTSMDSIDSAVDVPLAASSAGSTFAGTSSDLGSSNDPAPEKLPLPSDSDAADIDPEHAATWAL